VITVEDVARVLAWADGGTPAEVAAAPERHPVARRRPAVPRGHRRRGVKHGTLTAYAKHGCRCEPCRAAAAKHRRRGGATITSAS
jgi:hypothetical protein